MSLEAVIQDLIVALNANTEAHGGASGKSAAAGKAGAAKAAKGAAAAGKAAKKPKGLDFETLEAKAVEFADAAGKPKAQKIIKQYAASLADVAEDDFQALYDELEEALAEIEADE